MRPTFEFSRTDTRHVGHWIEPIANCIALDRTRCVHASVGPRMFEGDSRIMRSFVIRPFSFSSQRLWLATGRCFHSIPRRNRRASPKNRRRPSPTPSAKPKLKPTPATTAKFCQSCHRPLESATPEPVPSASAEVSPLETETAHLDAVAEFYSAADADCLADANRQRCPG